MTIQWGMLLSSITGQRKTFQDALALAIDLYKCGWSLADIAKHGFHNQVSYMSVKKLLTTAGVKLRPRGGPNHMKYIHVTIEDYKTLTYEQIAEKYKCSVTSVLRATKQFRCSCGKRKCTGDLCHSTEPHEGDPYP